MRPDENVALNNCANEPVHIPGRIQSFAALVGFDIASGTLQYFSDNLTAMFPTIPAPAIGSNFDELITERSIIHAIRGALSLPSIATQRDRIGVFELAGVRADFSVYKVGEVGVVEIEVVQDSGSRPQSSVATVRAMLSALKKGEGVCPLLDSSVAALRHATGFDRVMAYRFFDNGDGEIIGEAKGPGIDPFLGLRYPAFDIPLQVRQIMLRAPFRFIDDIRDPHAALVKDPRAPRLDLTFSHLRGVSPIYVEYLENMGVRATMNVSLVVRDKLWGMFAFHHYRKKRLDPDRRSICELFGQLVSMQIYQELEQEAFNDRNRAQSIMSSLNSSGASIDEIFAGSGDSLREVLRADGIALVKDRHIIQTGETPEEKTTAAIANLSDDSLVCFDRLNTTTAAANGGLNKTAGSLIVRLENGMKIAFFRNEILHEVRWAGSPEKTIETGPNGPRLTPRGSFDEYKQSVSGSCHPWQERDTAAANEIRHKVYQLAFPTSGASVEDREKEKRYQDLLIAELNHRVRNTLALTQSIVRQSHGAEQSLSHYVTSLEQRITALSNAHDLIGDSGLQWARIDELVRAELKPFEGGTSVVSVSGPSIAVRADVAPVVSLLVHELTSNAVKHGALSEHGVALAVSWESDAGGVKVLWDESVSKKIEPPSRQGFGLALIERAVPFECNGRVDVDFREAGLAVEFWLPANSIQQLSEQEALQQKRTQSSNTTGTLQLDLTTVMIVEDNMVLAMEMEKLLGDLGASETGSFSSSEAAIESLDRVNYSSAVLDINLGGSDTFGLASVLQEKKIPFIFVSGYDSKYEIPTELKTVARLTKPVNKADLILALETVMRAQE